MNILKYLTNINDSRYKIGIMRISSDTLLIGAYDEQYGRLAYAREFNREVTEIKEILTTLECEYIELTEVTEV